MTRLTVFTLVLFLCIVSASFGQEESSNFISKGQWMAGGRMALSTNDDFDAFSFSVTPLGGYFFGKKIAAGLQANYSSNEFHSNDISTTNRTVGVSPFIRYYMGVNRIAPFAEFAGGAQWSKSENNNPGYFVSTYKNSYSSYSVGMGLNYFISRDVALEGLLRYKDSNNSNSSSSNGYLDFNVGLQFFLSRNNKSVADEEGNYFSKGQWIIGGTGSLYLGNFDDLDAHSFSVAPMAGYLVGKKIAIGLSTGYGHTKGTSDSFSATPFFRYYFTQKKLAPYAEVAYGANWTRIEYMSNNETVVQKNSSSLYRISAGLNFFISKNVALDGRLGYSRINDADSGTLGLSVGLQFFIR